MRPIYLAVTSCCQRKSEGDRDSLEMSYCNTYIRLKDNRTRRKVGCCCLCILYCSKNKVYFQSCIIQCDVWCIHIKCIMVIFSAINNREIFLNIEMHCFINNLKTGQKQVLTVSQLLVWKSGWIKNIKKWPPNQKVTWEILDKWEVSNL